ADTYSGYTVNYNDDHYIDMYEKYYDSNLIEVFGINYHTNMDESIEEDGFYKGEVTNLIIDDGSFEYLDGVSPNAMYPDVDQIAITDYYLDCYAYYNDGHILEIGDKIRLNGVQFTICGIVDTSYEKYLNYDESDLFTSMAFQENLEYYNAFYISSLGQTYWWDHMTFFEEDVKYTIVTKIPSETKYSRVVMRKLTTEPPSLTSAANFVQKKNGMVSKELWIELLEMSYTDPIIASYSISFVCSTRAKYTFSFRATAMYDSMATSFENKSKYEVIVGASLFEKYRDKQQMCKFLLRRTDPNYETILINENVINQSFTFAKATWNRANSSKYVMIEFILTMILIMTVFAFIMHSMTMNSEKKKIGIKYSFGITKQDIVKPYIYEIVLYTVIALITSFAITKFLYPLIVNGLIYTTEQEIKEYYFFYIGLESIFGWDALIYAIMFLSLFVMVYKIIKKSPIEIIKDL
nr:ABC transporter permease [Bacilli bacterium]